MRLERSNTLRNDRVRSSVVAMVQRRSFLVALASLPGLASHPGPGDALESTIDQLADELRTLPADEAPDRLTNDRHYLTSNERRLDLFRPEVDEVGGIHLGVGSDPSYFIAAWSRARLLVLVDFDEDIATLHRLWSCLLGNAAFVEEFIELWSPAGAARVHRMLDDSALGELYDRAGIEVSRRLSVMRDKLAQAHTSSFLDDPAQYAHLHELASARRIVSIRGDFTCSGAIRSVATAIAAAEAERPSLHLGTLYLSNIEQYFMYGAAFRDNMLTLPLRERTIVLRTLPGRPAGFEYLVQRGDNFATWLRSRKTTSVYRMRGLEAGEHLDAGRKYTIVDTPNSTQP